MANINRDFEFEASGVYQSLLTSGANRIRIVLQSGLDRVRGMIINDAKSITSAKGLLLIAVNLGVSRKNIRSTFHLRRA